MDFPTVTILLAAGVSFAVAYAVLNRASGGGLGEPPGRPLFWTAPIAGVLAALLSADWRFGLVVALSYFIWRLGPWGRWYDLGRDPDGWNRPGIEKTSYEKVIEAISGGTDHAAFFWRNTLGILPGFVLLTLALSDWSQGWTHAVVTAPWWIPLFSTGFGLIVTGIYEISWQLDSRQAIPVAEIGTGAFWGLLVVTWSFM